MPLKQRNITKPWMCVRVPQVTSFSHQSQMIISHWSLSHSKSQITRTLINILGDDKNGTLWNFSIPLSKDSGTVPGMPFATRITAILILQSFFKLSCKGPSVCISLFFAFFMLLPYLSSSLTYSLPSLNLLCHSNTDARFMQDG